MSLDIGNDLHLKGIVKTSTISGSGVFAKENITPDTIIEKCPVLLLDSLPQVLVNYCFVWPKSKSPALALGYGSLYNHSDSPNAKFTTDTKNKQILIRALTPIANGEEIFIHYSEKWFKTRGGAWRNNNDRLKQQLKSIALKFHLGELIMLITVIFSAFYL